MLMIRRIASDNDGIFITSAAFSTVLNVMVQQRDTEGVVYDASQLLCSLKVLPVLDYVVDALAAVPTEAMVSRQFLPQLTRVIETVGRKSQMAATSLADVTVRALDCARQTDAHIAIGVERQLTAFLELQGHDAASVVGMVQSRVRTWLVRTNVGDVVAVTKS